MGSDSNLTSLAPLYLSFKSSNYTTLDRNERISTLPLNSIKSAVTKISQEHYRRRRTDLADDGSMADVDLSTPTRLTRCLGRPRSSSTLGAGGSSSTLTGSASTLGPEGHKNPRTSSVFGVGRPVPMSVGLTPTPGPIETREAPDPSGGDGPFRTSTDEDDGPERSVGHRRG